MVHIREFIIWRKMQTFNYIIAFKHQLKTAVGLPLQRMALHVVTLLHIHTKWLSSVTKGLTYEGQE